VSTSPASVSPSGNGVITTASPNANVSASPKG
jgi:hypothetical protein